MEAPNFQNNSPIESVKFDLFDEEVKSSHNMIKIKISESGKT